MKTEQTKQTEQHDVNDISYCTNMHLRQATRLVSQAFEAALQAGDIKATQFTLLVTVREMGTAPLTKLAEVMVMDRTTLTRNLKPLVTKGYIQIGTSQDLRVREIQLTAKGRQVVEQTLPQWQQIQQKVVARIGQQRWLQLIEDLQVTVDALKSTG